MEKIRWGIIGCGDVTEVKSGPAFNKVEGSTLVAVMRRNANLAEDYARRHHVPTWYTDANALINDPEVNAIYVATPPSSHEQYAIAAMQAGKPVYVEKPMTMNVDSAKSMVAAASSHQQKMVVAHYRRAQPIFKTIKQLIDEKRIRESRIVRLTMFKKLMSEEELKNPQKAWRVNKSESGGGLFHDLAPHQLDLLIYFFGEVAGASGYGCNQKGAYDADDTVTGCIEFVNGVMFTGVWAFTMDNGEEIDKCEIIGDKGRIEFSFFSHSPILVTIGHQTDVISFQPLEHVQQPMIQEVVNYFLNKGRNPCSGEEGVKVMDLIDRFTS
ncbi:MAG: Gfo/Idh/MocA family oxidoreductase [Chitinophagaceae bacterium]|nr:Gfo/Idh/MocA family oxidoreductase [Chitinophagaceae bacterium]